MFSTSYQLSNEAREHTFVCNRINKKYVGKERRIMKKQNKFWFIKQICEKTRSLGWTDRKLWNTLKTPLFINVTKPLRAENVTDEVHELKLVTKTERMSTGRLSLQEPAGCFRAAFHLRTFKSVWNLIQGQRGQQNFGKADPACSGKTPRAH